MAFREGLLQKVDLMGMADLLARQQSASRNEKNKTGDMADQAGMQQLLRWGIPATEENLRKLRGGFLSAGQDTMTLQDPMLKGTDIGAYKVPLSEIPGYVSGTPGSQVSAERAATAQAMIGAMGQSAAAASRGGGGGGRSSGGAGDNGPNVLEIGDGRGGVMVGSNLGTGQGYGYAGPDKSIAPNTVQAAGALGNTMAQPKQNGDQANIRDLIVEQMTNRDSLNDLTTQAQVMGKMSSPVANRLMGDFSNSIDRENSNILKPTMDLERAKQDEMDRFKAGLQPSMDEKIVPTKEAIGAKGERDAEQFKTQENYKIQAQNRVTKSITSDPRFDMPKSMQDAALSAVPAEMALAASQGLNNIDLDAFFAKYGRKKKGK
jgi:hypothetical protein